MGKVIKNPVCKRCGYIYDPLFPEVQVIEMIGKGNRKYVACAKCLEEVGRAPLEKRQEIIASFCEKEADQ